MRIRDWSSDVCSSDLLESDIAGLGRHRPERVHGVALAILAQRLGHVARLARRFAREHLLLRADGIFEIDQLGDFGFGNPQHVKRLPPWRAPRTRARAPRSEERRVGEGCVSTCRYRW